MEEEKAHYYKWKKPLVWIGSILIALVVLTVIAGAVLQHKLPGLLRSAVKENSKGLYKLEFEDMQVSVLRGQVKVGQVYLVPDTLKYLQMSDKPGQLLEAKVKEIKLTGFKLITFLLTKKIKVASLVIEKPVLTQWTMPVYQSKSSHENIFDLMKKKWGGSKINQISITDIHYRNVDWDKRAGKGGWLKHLNIEVDGFWINPELKTDTTRCWMTENIRCYGNNITYQSTDTLYKFHIAKLDASTKSRTLSLDSLGILPAYTETQWSKNLPYKRDRYDMTFPKIDVKNIHFKELEQQGRLLIDSLIIKKPLIHIYADKGMPEHTTIATKNFPSLAFQRLKFPLTVKDMRLLDGDIYYKERNPKSGKAGTIFFKQLNGQLSNVSNDSVQLKQQAWITSHFTTYFLGQPKLTLDLNFNMRDTSGGFNYKGTLAGAPASLFNQILEPLTLARAESGYIHSIGFNIKANRYGASVQTEMLYNDFKMALLDAKSGELQKKGFLSLFINWVAIKNDNPPKADEPPRVANHYYQHDQEKTFFNLMWKAVYSGLKSNLGLPN